MFCPPHGQPPHAWFARQASAAAFTYHPISNRGTATHTRSIYLRLREDASRDLPIMCPSRLNEQHVRPSTVTPWVISLSARGKAEGTRHVIEHFHDDPTMRKWHLSTPIPFGATCLGQGVVNFSDSSHDATSCTHVPYHEGARHLFALIPIPLSAFARVTAPQSKPLSWTSASSSTSPASTGPTAGLRGRSLTHITTCSTSIRGPFSL